MDPDDTDRHWWLYERALDEVRGQVDRGWAHTQFFILLNAAIVGAVLAFYGGRPDRTLAVIMLLGAAIVGVAGIFVLRENKRYYRTLSVKRASLERHLGLDQNIPGTRHPLAIYALSPTADADKLHRMTQEVASYVRPRLRWGSVSDWARWTLVALVAFDLAAAIGIAAGRA